ncbi:response regulator [Flavobacterium aquidurense]|uniref:Response regulator receiver protein n=1 Tax=Flavobacterium aquidurense TaxID=362413 RepID=A0A0Q0S3D3_9FLAO|nr:response regulator [Flavobacterium aquidurense]KQB39901.1 Response regulator receiver protein [Flavobacterium aquidurense]
MKNTVILLVDDDEDDCELFIAAIASLNKNIITTISNNSLEALNNLKAATVLPDFIFLDMQMPYLSGAEFIQQLRQIPELNKIQLVVYSSHTHDTLKKLTNEFDSVQIFTKPNNFQELVRTLDNIIG